MSAPPSLVAQAGDLGYQLDHLAARATRAAADLRCQSRWILDDLVSLRRDLEQIGVHDAGSRTGSSDDLTLAVARLRCQTDEIGRRLTEAQHEAATAWSATRDGITAAARDACRTFESFTHLDPAPRRATRRYPHDE